MATVTQMPPELWSEVFGFSTTGTLANVSSVCKAFKSLAQKHLYRTLYWDDSHYARARTWDDPSICNYPQSLVLMDASSKYFHRQIMARHQHAMDPDQSADIIRRWQLAMYRDISSTIKRFTHLVSLEFRNSTMPNGILSILHELPALEDLSILSGIFDTSSIPVTVPPRLKSLTLWRSRDSEQVSWPRTFPQLLTSLLTPTLRTLRIDWTQPIAMLVTNQLPTSPAPTIPQLTTLCIRTPAGMSWVEGSPHFSLIAPLRTFLISLTGLQTFKIVGGLPDMSPLPDNALPNLRTFSGPAGIALRMCSRLHKLSLTDEWLTASVVANSLQAMERAGASPKSLDLQLSAWDMEILYAVAALFKNMEELKIRYLARGSGPDEAQLVSIGPDILDRMPKIRSFHVYQEVMEESSPVAPGPYGYGYTAAGRRDHRQILRRVPSYLEPSEEEVEARDEEVDEALRAWKRYGHTLAEVKLDHAGIWRRANRQDEWAKRDHNPLDEDDGTDIV